MTSQRLEMLRPELERIVTERFSSTEEPGCAVLIVSGNETLTMCRGLAELEPAVPVSTDTNFRLASVAKQFTAAAILQLRDDGRLGLDQTVQDLFPDFPRYGSRITVEHLLRHTSGIMDYEPLVGEKGYELAPLDGDVLNLLAEQDAGDFEPGSRFRYSNSGYAVLAMIVEAVSRKTFPEYLKEFIFDPLGMAGSVALVNRPGHPDVMNRAYGHDLDASGRWVRKDQSMTSSVIGDGGVYTSLRDYERWIRGYMNGKVLDLRTVAQAWTRGVTTGDEIVPYGYGWRLESLPRDASVLRPYHPGSTTGFRNGVVLDTARERAVLVLTNRCSGDSVALAKALEAVVTSQDGE